VVPFASGALGWNVAVPPLADAVPATGVAPFASLNVAPVTVRGLRDSLNVAVTDEFTATSEALAAGETPATEGGVVSAAADVVKDQVRSADMALPARSWTPVVTVAVYATLLASGAFGWKVAVVPFPASVTVPGTLVVPCLSRKFAVVIVDAFIASLKVAVTGAETETDVALLTGAVDATVGGAVSGAALVVKDQVRFAARWFAARSVTAVVTVAV
jgi:hypothetical protein